LINPLIVSSVYSCQASIGDISKTFRAYLIIFPDSERHLIELAQALFLK
jgi:vacuolar protein sorting-associated protein 51